MGIHESAQALGRLGGEARARALSRERRKQIASRGGRVKALSHHAARRIRENFRYLKAADALRRSSRIHDR